MNFLETIIANKILILRCEINDILGIYSYSSYSDKEDISRYLEIRAFLMLSIHQAVEEIIQGPVKPIKL